MPWPVFNAHRVSALKAVHHMVIFVIHDSILIGLEMGAKYVIEF